MKNADQILILDRGCIEMQGKHKDLLKYSSTYSIICNEQNK